MKKKKKPAKKCRTHGFVTDCAECGRSFVAGAHVAPKCGGGYQDHSEHHEDDCCGYGDHTERRIGLICTNCVFQRNMDRMS